ncbi:MAG: CpsB/CapC family capsule biosynthesis tyrosine phosphatase [Gemmatimonadota bacterium]
MSIVDFHSHLIPGVDDGAVDRAESLAALCALAEQGVTAAVATPHVDAAITTDPDALAARLEQLDRGWQILCAAAADAAVNVRLYRGVELNLDTPNPVLDDPRLRLAGGAFVLMEFPFMTVPPHAARAVRQLRERGVIPIVAHPERYHNLDTELRLAGEWRDAGAYLQVNGGSLLGRYGKEARQRAGVLLERGWADYLSSDYHARGDPQVRAYEDVLLEAGAEEQVHLLMRSNPARLLEGRAPIPVPPYTVSRTLLDRLRELFR